MIELSAVIGELRRELEEAVADARGTEFRFDLGPIELEVEVGVERRGGGEAKVRFWVLELGADREIDRSTTQRVTLTLHPRLASTGGPPYVSGAEAELER